jgi:phosphopantetheine adenylyltransferase
MPVILLSITTKTSLLCAKETKKRNERIKKERRKEGKKESSENV